MFFALWAKLWGFLHPALSNSTPLFDAKMRFSIPPGSAGGNGSNFGGEAGPSGRGGDFEGLFAG